jgi:hypothetical protein
MADAEGGRGMELIEGAGWDCLQDVADARSGGPVRL